MKLLTVFKLLHISSLASLALSLPQSKPVTYVEVPVTAHDGSGNPEILVVDGDSDFGNATSSNLSLPIVPGHGIRFDMKVQRAPAQHIPLGRLAHHLLSLVNTFWKRIDDTPVTRSYRYQDPDFKEIITQITGNPRSSLFTPINLARGLDTVVEDVIVNNRAKPVNYDWIFAGQVQGSTLTVISNEHSSFEAGGSSNFSQSNATYEDLSNYPPGTHTESEPVSSSVNGTVRATFAPVRPGEVQTKWDIPAVPLLPSPFLACILRCLDHFWTNDARDEIGQKVSEASTILFTASDGPWRLKFEHAAILKEDGTQIVWGEITDRILRMLQLPAYVEKWAAMESLLFIGKKFIAKVSIYRDDFPRVRDNGTAEGATTTTSVPVMVTAESGGTTQIPYSGIPRLGGLLGANGTVPEVF